jgi:CRISPR-associated protein Cmr3
MSKHPKPHKSPRYDKLKGPKAASRAPERPKPGPAQVAPASALPAPPSAVLTLDPLAPVICRSGRPFDGQAGPDGARFPPPSTVAGCLRTAWAQETGKPLGPDLMQLAIAGPLLARPRPTGGLRLYAPKPADALYFGAGAQARCVRAAPTRLPDGSGADLPAGLLPVCLSQAEEEKPGKGPAWWAWEDVLDFRTGQNPGHTQLAEGGWSPPVGDRRTHVAIDRETLAARTGQLFQTEGLDLAPPLGLNDDPESGLRLLVRCAEPLAETLVHLGGERRLARLEPRPEDTWPEPPEGWIETIRAAKGLTLTLLTPALFAAGYRPGWLQPDSDGLLSGAPPGLPGLTLRLRAAAVGRWQPHSGWDLAAQAPRAGRKLVPAGAVYWLEVLGESRLEDLNALWLASLCDHPQDRRDGFGLALPAHWDPAAINEYNPPK